MASVHLIGLRISLWQCLGDHEGGGVEKIGSVVEAHGVNTHLLKH